MQLDKVEPRAFGLRDSRRVQMQFTDGSGSVTGIAQPGLHQDFTSIKRCVVDSVAM
jgi:hypothetical protein